MTTDTSSATAAPHTRDARSLMRRHGLVVTILAATAASCTMPILYGYPGGPQTLLAWQACGPFGYATVAAVVAVVITHFASSKGSTKAVAKSALVIALALAATGLAVAMSEFGGSRYRSMSDTPVDQIAAQWAAAAAGKVRAPVFEVSYGILAFLVLATLAFVALVEQAIDNNRRR